MRTTRSARRIARDLSAVTAQRYTYRRLAAALEAIPEEHRPSTDDWRDECRRLHEKADEYDREIDHLVEEAILSGYEPEDLENA